jgi:hypothetical protein
LLDPIVSTKIHYDIQNHIGDYCTPWERSQIFKNKVIS